jgi:hypothetical protein
MSKVDEQIEQVLSGARPRPAPRGSRKEEIYQQLHGEWLAGNQAFRRRRRYFAGALAASILAAGAIAIRLGSFVDTPIIQPDAVVALTRGDGLSLNGEPLNDFIPRNAPLRLHSGDTVATGPDGVIAIAWRASASLRVSASTELTFVDADVVKLVSGEIYFDSHVFDSADEAAITVETPHGRIEHVGTQFLASTGPAVTRISVREGFVSFGNTTQAIFVRSGQSASVRDGQPAKVSEIALNDASWDWVAAAAPEWDIDGRSTMDILRWLGRETGLALEFADDRVEEFVRRDRIRGIGEIGPNAAMRVIPVATGLRFTVSGSTIEISMEDDE